MPDYAHPRRARFALFSLILPAILLPSSASAQSRAADRAAELVDTCQIPLGAIVMRDEKAIVLLDRVPADEKVRGCIFKMQNEHFSETMVIISEEWIDRALEGRREAERRVALTPAHIEKVVRVLAAVRERDAMAIEREGVLGKPYIVDQSSEKGTPESTSAFRTQSLQGFERCRSMTPRLGGMDWIAVQWRCPREAEVPFSISQTNFQFEGLEIVGIRTGPGLVAIAQPPQVRVPQPEKSHAQD